MDPSNTLPYSDSFLDTDPAPDAELPFSTPSHSAALFHLKSPATPTLHSAFNPDDFLVSSPPAATPDLKRRLFADLPTRTAIPFPLDHQTPIIPRSPAVSIASSLPVPSSSVSAALHVAPVVPHTPFQPRIATSVPAASSQFSTKGKTKCNCKASRCLKLYCPCFATSSVCSGTCTCKNCSNTQAEHHLVVEARNNVLARDPRAFDPRIRNAQSNSDIHAKGCNCRKGCSKNYCVCREMRVMCGPRCTCSGPNGCQNGKCNTIQMPNKARKTIRKKLSRPPPTPFTPQLSPPFPNFDISPGVPLANIDHFRQLMSDDPFVTPFAGRKMDPAVAAAAAASGQSSGFKTELQPVGTPLIIEPRVKRKISMELDAVAPSPLNDGVQSTVPKRRILSTKFHSVNIKPSSNTTTTTPEHVERLPDVKFISSPTTVGRKNAPENASDATTPAQPSFVRDDKIDLCRVPRILRVKMGSGKSLRKFNI